MHVRMHVYLVELADRKETRECGLAHPDMPRSHAARDVVWRVRRTASGRRVSCQS